MAEYYEALELAKKIEKNALSPMAFKEKVEVVSAIDFYPEEYVSLSYPDLINMYERVEKIKSASKLGIYGAPEEKVQRQVAGKKAEIEEKVKEITATRLEEIKEFEFEGEKPLEKPPEPEEKPAETELLEFEIEKIEHKEKEPEDELAFEIEEEKKPEKPEPKAFEIERPEEEKEEEKEEKKEEKPETKIEVTPPKEEMEFEKPAVEKREEEKPGAAPATKAPVPAILREAPEAAGGKFRDVEEYFTREWGGKIDESMVKKKMLDLTKELFKEKSVTRREKLKLEIVVLKNMLGRTGEKPARAGAKAAPATKEYATNLLDTLVSTQTSELSAKKDTIASLYKNRIAESKKKFYSGLKGVPEDNTSERKRIFDSFSQELSAISRALPGDVAKIKDFVMQKHMSELESFRQSSGADNPAVLKSIDLRSAEIRGYTREFQSISDLINKNIETMLDSASGEVVTRAQGEQETAATVYEINETDEGTLLYYLHSKNQEFYKKYERNKISKSEALQYAKFLMAKEKGLSAADTKKYFGDVSHLEA